MPPILLSILITMGMLLLTFLILTYFLYRMVFYSSQKGQGDAYQLTRSEQMDAVREEALDMIQKTCAIPFEEVSVKSHDGLTLCGLYYHQSDDAPLHIFFHGYRGHPCRDFSGGARASLAMGANVLLAQHRAHLHSQGHTITFGVKERQDVLSWVHLANTKLGGREPIILIGISMGAATVILSAALPLPSNVVGIIADCPYSSPKAILQKVVAEKKVPPSLGYGLLEAGARLFGHFSMAGVSVVDAARKAKLPILLLHGEDDRFVPCEMSREIQAANPALITLYTFPGAGHGISYLSDTERYLRLTRTFMEECYQKGAVNKGKIT